MPRLKKHAGVRANVSKTGITPVHASNNSVEVNEEATPPSIPEKNEEATTLPTISECNEDDTDEYYYRPLSPEPDLTVEDVMYFEYMENVASVGSSYLPWDEVSRDFPAFFERFFNRTCRYYDRFTIFPTDLSPNSENRCIYKFIIEKVQKFDDFPFTWRRFCEILINPTRYYKRMISLMRGLERVINVESTISLNSESKAKDAEEEECIQHLESLFFKKDGEDDIEWNTIDMKDYEMDGCIEDDVASDRSSFWDSDSSEELDDDDWDSENVEPIGDRVPRGKKRRYEEDESEESGSPPRTQSIYDVNFDDDDDDDDVRSSRGDHEDDGNDDSVDNDDDF